MGNVIPFHFEGAAVRVNQIDGEPWFVGRDVAEILGYAEPHKAVARHCKGGMDHPIPTQGGVQMVKMIPERDVYRLIMRSKRPDAERFEEWVVGEVLPSIRKTGAYVTPGMDKDMRSAIGGIVKGVVHKELTEILPALVAQALATDPRVAACDYQSAFDVVAKLGAIPKGRRSLSKRAGDRMDRISKAWAVPVKLSAERKVRLFSSEVVQHWTETEGREAVRHHNTKAKGQGQLRLVPTSCG